MAAKRVGGFDIFAKLLNITTPMDFLHLFDDMKNAIGKYVDDVKRKDFPNENEQY